MKKNITFLIFCVFSAVCYAGTRTETEKFIFTNTVTMEEKAIISEGRILNNYNTNLVVHETLSLPTYSVRLLYLHPEILETAYTYVSNNYYRIGTKVPTAETADNALLFDSQNSAYYRNANNINAGTLSTDRYSAYADLVAESKVGNTAGIIPLNNSIESDGLWSKKSSALQRDGQTSDDWRYRIVWDNPYARLRRWNDIDDIKVGYSGYSDNSGLLNSQNSAYYRNADNINAGTLNSNRVANLPASKITSGTFSTDRIPNLDASKITSGALNSNRVANLPASKITSGTFSTAQIPSLDASKITTGTLDSSDRVPNLPASKITSGTIGVNYYDAYNNLSHFSKFGSTDDNHILRKIDGDHIYSVLGHNHDGSYSHILHNHTYLHWGANEFIIHGNLGNMGARNSVGPKHFWYVVWNGDDAEYQLWVSQTDVGGGSMKYKAFSIKHPIEKLKDEKVLVHSCIEGPRADLIYRGEIQLEKGIAEINIDNKFNMTEGTFETLTKNVQYFLQNSNGWDPVKGKVIKNILAIESKNKESNDIISWMVIAERNDPTIKLDPRSDETGSLINEFNQLKDSDNEDDFIIMSSQDGVKYKVRKK